ncbi:Arabinose efflux permease family protein [uncultured Sporomusa sp.]|uniref:Arabinose efflux permease family protein n=1 Tax=uncultured Sporomusa sp. TaxID=307249 RepID=A0A212LNQ1_9FIRM|nr:MFS transporter [uncultured Sporomusa sp.]SCM79158.1 Arabinose efflux permease family protein [uncultured Sporomusa sp.]
MKTNDINNSELLWSKNFILITTISFFTMVGFQMLLPTLPVYAIKLGGTSASAGLVIGIFTISSVIIRPFVGYALDRYGRKLIIMAGLLLFAICVLSYTWAWSLTVLLLLRFLHGFTWGVTSTATNTTATDIIPKSRLGEGMGYYGLAGTLSMALAPALGLWVLSQYDFSTMFLTSFLMCTLAIILSLPIQYQSPSKDKITFRFIETSAVNATIIILLITMTYGAIVSFIALYAAERGITNIGSFFTVYAVFLAITRPFSGKIADKKGFDFVIIPGIILIIFAMGCLYIANQLGIFLLAAAIYGVGFGMVSPSLQALSVMNAPANRRGTANGTFFTGFDLGIGISSILWGAVAQVTGYSFMFLYTILPCLLALFIYKSSAGVKQTSN